VVDRLVEFGVREPLQGASRHPAAGGSTGQHSANISGRMARGDSQAGRPRRALNENAMRSKAINAWTLMLAIPPQPNRKLGFHLDGILTKKFQINHVRILS
jgi:hypothetical protein